MHTFFFVLAFGYKVYRIDEIPHQKDESFPSIEFSSIDGKHKNHQHDQADELNVHIEIHCSIVFDRMDQSRDSENEEDVEDV